VLQIDRIRLPGYLQPHLLKNLFRYGSVTHLRHDVPVERTLVPMDENEKVGIRGLQIIPIAEHQLFIGDGFPCMKIDFCTEHRGKILALFFGSTILMSHSFLFAERAKERVA